MQNFFEILGLEPIFLQDDASVERAYFAAQRAWHPDRFVGKPAAERLEAAQKSSDVNAAYRALKDPLTRAQHLLECHGIHVNSERDTFKPQSELLLEIMERREALEAAADASLTISDTQAAVAETLHALESAFAAHNWQAAAHQAMRLKYLRALLEDATKRHQSLATNH